MTHEDATTLFYRHVWPHRAMVRRTAGFLAGGGGNHAAAEDLAQETLVKAFKSMAQFDVTSNAKAWISTILRNTWIDYLRAAGKRTALSLDDSEIEIPETRQPESTPNVAD